MPITAPFTFFSPSSLRRHDALKGRVEALNAVWRNAEARGMACVIVLGDFHWFGCNLRKLTARGSLAASIVERPVGEYVRSQEMLPSMSEDVQLKVCCRSW